MIGVLTSSAVDRGFELRLGQTKDYTIGIWSSTQQFFSYINKLIFTEMMIVLDQLF
jgi:hypothetical protein